jgi:hypothetical protein
MNNDPNRIVQNLWRAESLGVVDLGAGGCDKFTQTGGESKLHCLRIRKGDVVLDEVHP